MKYFKSYTQFITEKDSQALAIMMLFLNNPILQDIHSHIEKEDIYTDETNSGLEKESHVTLLYGIHSDEVDHHEVFKKIENLKVPNILILYNISLFENNKYDVLKFDIKGKELHEFNSKLSELPNSNEFPEYHPHSTIAYLKTGKGKKYVDMFKDIEIETVPTKFVYSLPNRLQIIRNISSKQVFNEKFLIERESTVNSVATSAVLYDMKASSILSRIYSNLKALEIKKIQYQQEQDINKKEFILLQINNLKEIKEKLEKEYQDKLEKSRNRVQKMSQFRRDQLNKLGENERKKVDKLKNMITDTKKRED